MTVPPATTGMRPLQERLAHIADTPRWSEEAQGAFYDQIADLTALAEARAGTRRHWLDVAGVVIELVFTGHALEDILMPALAHLEVPAANADAIFHVWDSASTGVQMIPPPMPRDSFTERGDIWGLQSENILSAYHWSDFSLALAAVDAATGIYWVNEPDCIPYWGRASPLRTLFHWAMRWHGRHLLHAAAIGTADGAMLITGKGGVGKSTTALSCLVHGMRYVGDDYLIVALDPAPMVYSLYGTAKVNADQLRKFPLLREQLVNESTLAEEKAVFQLFPRHADRIAIALPLRAVVAPEFAGRPETSFGPIDMARLNHAASFTTISQLPHAGRESEVFIEQLIASAPAMTIRLGADLPGIPLAIAGWLADPAPMPALAKSSHRPTLSVIIPVHNGAHFVASAVESVLAQGWETLEILIIDDGSEDDLAAAVAKLPVEIRLFQQASTGPAGARNRGIREAHGELIAFLDVDDLWPPGRLDALYAEFEADPSADIAFGHAQVFREREDGSREYLGNPAESYPHSFGAALYRCAAFDRVGLLDPELRFSEDTDWANRAREKGVKVARLPLVSLLVRRHEGNMTRGRSRVEVNELRMFKKLLDRKRDGGAAV